MKINRRQVIKLTEEQIKKVVQIMVNEQSEIDEYGVKGMRKDDTDLWDEGDQMLAMYNAEYGIEELGISKSEAVREIIGTTIGSLAKQTSNFNYLAGRGGLDRPNKMQKFVYNKFKGIEKNVFKKACLDLIENRLKSPTERVIKRKLASEIGHKRDEASNERKEKLRIAGINPDKATMIGQRPKNEPTPEDYEDDETDIEEPMTPQKSTSKDEVRTYLKQIHDKLVNSNPDLADDIQFISDYIDSELVNKDMLSEIRKIFKHTITEDKPNKMKKVVKIKESDIKNIVKRIIKEQQFDTDSDFDDRIDNEMKQHDDMDRYQSDDYNTSKPLGKTFFKIVIIGDK